MLEIEFKSFMNEKWGSTKEEVLREEK